VATISAAEPSRRDFLYIATAAAGAAGTPCDFAGRIRQGPAPPNLPLPAYQFVSDAKIRIGEAAPANA